MPPGHVDHPGGYGAGTAGLQRGSIQQGTFHALGVAHTVTNTQPVIACHVRA